MSPLYPHYLLSTLPLLKEGFVTADHVYESCVV